MSLNDDETIDSDGCGLLLHCDHKTVDELARRGTLPAIKFGKSWIFIRAQVVETVAQMASKQARERAASHSPLGVLMPRVAKAGRPLPKLPSMP